MFIFLKMDSNVYKKQVTGNIGKEHISPSDSHVQVKVNWCEIISHREFRLTFPREGLS